ncbi:hypothetical protein DVH24_034634 [Malus domestica]|uniref:Uncharacterized protein n=1 Tax=Malus domestica TaxID=3750 RepID=A0A498J050_MALDO|nr:hypothetical protein DVH24_034634 [Malus domestica]
MCKVWIVHITGPNLSQLYLFYASLQSYNALLFNCKMLGLVTGIQDLEQKWLIMQESKTSVKFTLKVTHENANHILKK